MGLCRRRNLPRGPLLQATELAKLLGACVGREWLWLILVIHKTGLRLAVPGQPTSEG